MKYIDENWPRVIENNEGIPEDFLGKFNSVSSDEKLFPYMIYLPQEKWGFRKVNPKLICLYPDKITLFEKHKKEIYFTVYFLKDIDYIHRGRFLLYSWLRISGISGNKKASTLIEFNTVRENIFTPVMIKIRTKLDRLDEGRPALDKLEIEKDKLSYLSESYYKFLNFSRESILSGEEVRDSVFQNGILLKFFKFFNKTITIPHLTILTDKELIIIKEDYKPRKSKIDRYGGHWYFIPPEKIAKLSIADNEEKRYFTLKVDLANGSTIENIYSIDNKAAVNSIIEEISRRRL
jgi:hypothetical protein